MDDKVHSFESKPKYIAARDSLPVDLREAYRQLVLDYSTVTLIRFGHSYAAYDVLADIIRYGWRPTETHFK